MKITRIKKTLPKKIKNKQQNILAIIPARGGSKRIPKKNIVPVAGKPMIFYTIEAALQSKFINRVVVSTDNQQIAEISRQCGAEVLIRPSELAEDHVKSEPVLQHVVRTFEETEGYTPDIIVFLQLTTVLRNNRHIDEALKKMIDVNGDSVLGVCKSHKYYWYGAVEESGANKGFWEPHYDYHNRYDVAKQPPKHRDNGAIYAFKRHILMEHNNRIGGRIVPYEMDEADVFEIDTYDDLRLVEQIVLSRRQKITKDNYRQQKETKKLNL